LASQRPSDLGRELLRQGLLDEQQLARAREVAGSEGLALDEAITSAGLLEEDRLLGFIAERYRIARVDLDDIPIDEQLIKLLPEGTARRYLALPLYRKGHVIVVALAEPWKVNRVDEVQFSIGRAIRPVLASRQQLRQKLDELFINKGKNGAETEGSAESGAFLQEALSDLEDAGLVTEGGQQESSSEQQLLRESSASPIVKIVNDILIRAIHKGASDIHIEPQETVVIVRFRVDGALREVMSLPAKVQKAIISRIKVLASMDISVARRPQDGRIKLHYRERPLDLRVSTLPTYWGEKVVMRVLDQSGSSLELDKLGFLRAEREQIERIMHQPQGMLLVTGPTGSGKTTTLYSVLSAINQVDVNIITVEDPVEYQLPKINQVPVNPKAGMTFAAGLRSILRQDPNIIMVGEIRDLETAEIALESAETGHMVFSTLHTNSAVGAVTRFLDMDVPGYLLASSLSGVLAQRLLRRLCPDCKEPAEIGEGLRTRFNIPPEVTFYEGKGCPTCDGQGTKGRLGAYELMLVDRDIADGIYQGVAEADLVDRARQDGMHLMFEDALIKAMQGKVSMAEVLRAIETPGGIEIDAGRLLAEADEPWEGRGKGHPAADARSGPARRTAALVVSGEAGHSRRIAALLETEGLAVDVTDSGRKALDLIREHRPGLVVADMDTPDLDGLVLAESLRREAEIRTTPLILLAEDDNIRTEIRALESGADELLTKPLDPDRFLARIRRVRNLHQRLAEELAGHPRMPPAQDADAGEDAAGEGN